MHAVLSATHWANGGDGALELADAVMDACNEKNDFKFLYPTGNEAARASCQNRQDSLRC